MKRKIQSFALIALLIVGSIAQTACGNATTLSRVGNVAVQLALGFEGEVNSLVAAGLIKEGPRLTALRQKVSAAKVSANALNAYLVSLAEVNASDKAQITLKVAELTAIISGVLINQDAFGLSENTGVVVVLRYATISLNQIALVIAALNPPAAGVAAASGAKSGIAVDKIKFEFTEPPATVKQYLHK